MSAGAVLLQGGAEMRPDCRAMDRELMSLAPSGPVVVVLGAATPGADHDRAADRAVRYHRDLLADRTVTVTPHPQVDLPACLDLVAGAAVVVLPGGSPARLHAGLGLEAGALGALLLRRHQDGAALSGASAGAMVLCSRTVLPDAARAGGGRGDPVVVDGLALLPGIALVHDDGGDTTWSDPGDPDGIRWGLPEAGGVLLHGGELRAVGHGHPRVLRRGVGTRLGRVARPLGDVLA